MKLRVQIPPGKAQARPSCPLSPPSIITLQRSNQSVVQILQKECSHDLEPPYREQGDYNSPGHDDYAGHTPTPFFQKENPLNCPTQQPRQICGHHTGPNMRSHDWRRMAPMLVMYDIPGLILISQATTALSPLGYSFQHFAYSGVQRCLYSDHLLGVLGLICIFSTPTTVEDWTTSPVSPPLKPPGCPHHEYAVYSLG